MYERSYGYKYDEGKGRSLTEIAKLIRSEIKVAQSEGLLPAQWKYSVVTRHGLSIDLVVKNAADAWTEPPADQLDRWGNPVTNPVSTEEAQAAKVTLQRIHGAYNHDGSEIQTDYFDVNYYGHVEFEDPSSAEFWAKEKARIAAKKAAREESPIVGKVRTNGKVKDVVHVLVKVGEVTRYACGAVPSRYTWTSPVPEDTEVTCSRCAKREAREQVKA